MAEQDNNFEGSGGYQEFLDKVGRAQDRMALGSQTLRDYYSPSNVVQRAEHRAKMFGFSGDYNSQYSRQEQMAMARSDMFSKIATTGNAATFGVGNVAKSLLSEGQLSMLLGKTSLISSITGGAAQAAGISGGSGLLKMGGALGVASDFLNGPMLAATVLLKKGEFFATHGLIDPYVNASMFQGTAMSSMRGVLGGTQSRLGTGGLSMTESLNIGRSMRNMQMVNRDISPDQMNALMSQAGSMPQMQFATSPDQAMQNIQKVVEFGAKITKYFGEGKGKEALQTIAQFGTMGMNIDQATRAFEKTQQMGTYLNVDPSRIMGVGASVSQMAIGTGINQGTLYNTGIQNFERAQRMIQSGAISQTQAQNFGGAEGIAQLTTGIQTKFFESRLGESVLRSMYSGGTSDEDSMKRLALGQMSLGEQRRRSTDITLSPRENMEFQMDKDSLISNMGENMNSIFFNQLNKLSANKNPYGSSLHGRARWMMATGMVQDKQQAMLMAQQWMQDPMMEQIRKERQDDQMMEQNDPYYSSGTSFGRGMSYFGRNVGRTVDYLKRDSIFSNIFGSTYEGSQLRNSMYGAAKNFGFDTIAGFFRDTTNTRDTQTMDMPFGKIKNAKEFRETVDAIRDDNTLGIVDPKVLETQRQARLLSYSQLENYSGADRDAVADITDKVKKDLKGMTGTSTEKAKELMKRYGYSENETIMNRKNIPVNLLKTMEGIVISEGSTGEEKARIQDMNLKTGGTGRNLTINKQEPGFWKSLGYIGGGALAGAVAGGFVGPVTATLGGLAGAVGGYMAVTKETNALNANMDFINEKFGNADVMTQIEMAQKMQRLGNATNPDDIRGSNKENLLLGGTRDAALQLYKDNKSKIDSIANLKGEELQKALLGQRGRDIRTGVDILYGGTGYKTLSGEITGNQNTIESLVEKFMFGEGNDADLKMTSDQYAKMKEQFKGKAGIGDVLKNTRYDESTGTVQIKEGISKKERDLALNNIYAAAGGGVNNAEKLWNEKMTGKASTIQDFATAFAKGMQMYETGSMSADWNKIGEKKDNPEKKGN